MHLSLIHIFVDDQPVVRSGLGAFLSIHDDLELVGEASDGARALALCTKINPDVILMDLIMPNMDGAEATTRIRQNFPEIQVLILTSFKEDELVQKALEAGAIGYLLKNISSDELANAIRSAHVGRPTLSPEATEVLIRKATHGQGMELGSDLTDREREVLQLVSSGLTNRAIGMKLSISDRTVQGHLASIYAKLQVSSRTEAVTKALNMGLIHLPEK